MGTKVRIDVTNLIYDKSEKPMPDAITCLNLTNHLTRPVKKFYLINY